ncbi:hypothetical protein Pint_22255 [Pistacia integerrima]|uniref:Uncharacterized protein n=1 Tax=Pistacia integerrima TaxID=434235 RepID=A0ACC0YHN9_9ROSI|nr:hypothetical protein Pint_22255 [Pistacia integerrima]
MDLAIPLHAFIPSLNSVAVLMTYFLYLAIAGSILPGKVVKGVVLQDRTRLHYRCNGLLLLVLLVALLGIGAQMDFVSPTVISDRGFELLSTTLMFCFLVSAEVTCVLFVTGCRSHNQGSSLKPHVTGNLLHDWWFGIQLNPQFMGIDLKFFFVRAGMMGWLLINLSVLAKSFQNGTLSQSMILYQLFCGLYILDYFVHEECMTSTWDIIAERLGFMLVFGDLVWIPFTFNIQACLSILIFSVRAQFSFMVTLNLASKPGQTFLSLLVQLLIWLIQNLKETGMGWWLLHNKVELTTAAVVANCLVFLIGYLVSRGANRQKHIFKKNPKAHIWGKPPKVIRGKLLASGYCSIICMKVAAQCCGISARNSCLQVASGKDYGVYFKITFRDIDIRRGVARHCNYLGDLLLALSFSLPCGISSPVPYFYPIYLLILLIWREREEMKFAVQRSIEKYGQNTVDLFLGEYYRMLISKKVLEYLLGGFQFILYHYVIFY